MYKSRLSENSCTGKYADISSCVGTLAFIFDLVGEGNFVSSVRMLSKEAIKTEMNYVH